MVVLTFHIVSVNDGLRLLLSTGFKARFKNHALPLHTTASPASLGYDPPSVDVVKQYCETHYTPHGRFHEAFRVLHLYRHPAVFLDIGGHEGITSFPPIACSRVRHRVTTVEPVRSNIDQLLKRAKQLGIQKPSYYWHLIEAAFSNRTSPSTRVYVPIGREDNSALDNATSTANVGGAARVETVWTMRGDEEVFDKGVKPDVIKIDVQGFELLVMKGLEKTLSQRRNMVVVSEYDSRLMLMNGMETIEPFDYMIARGFKCFCAPSLALDGNGAVYANNSSDELTREMMQTPGGRIPDVSKCGDLTYIKYIPS